MNIHEEKGYACYECQAFNKFFFAFSGMSKE